MIFRRNRKRMTAAGMTRATGSIARNLFLRNYKLKLLIALSVAAAYLFREAYIYLRDSEHFMLKEIEIIGNVNLSKEEIMDMCGIDGKTNLLFASSAEMEVSCAANPFIRTAVVEEILPGTLILKIEENVPSGLLMSEEGFHLLNARGEAYKTAGYEDFALLPVFKGFAGIEPPDRRQAEIIKAMDIYALYKRTGIGGFMEFEGIEYGEITGFSLIRTGDGIFARLGHEGFSENIVRLEAVLKEISHLGAGYEYVLLNNQKRRGFVTVKLNMVEKQDAASVPVL
ncbi:MAG: FtsQ-type POTRA domain-containing protein [Deltaproteobacteria bacterium]|nr:FtsQ-type POTRA domain-containing protein [Deltaproteobacteria bacterium]